MDSKQLHFSLSDPLHDLDTEKQTFGCRANNPDICKNCFIEGKCAFSSEDHICKSPSAKWKRFYTQLKEGK